MVEQARSRLRDAIAAARLNGVHCLKIIHGYGSSGVGGDLRIALQASLRQMAERREIQECIYGEDWKQGDERTWSLLKRVPELRSDSDLGRGNRGITVVVL